MSWFRKNRQPVVAPPVQQPAPQGVPIPDIPPDEQPIDDNVWFKLSRSWVNNADDRIQKQAENIQGTIKWFFGLGSSATIIGIFLKDPKLDTISGWLFAGVVLFMMISFALATLATTTISKSVDQPNDANAIREVFNKSNNEARWYLVGSSSCLLLGMALIAPALLQSFKPTEPKDTRLSFVGSYETKLLGKDVFLSSIHLSGHCGVAKTILIRIDTGKSAGEATNVIHFSQPVAHADFDIAYSIAQETSLKLSKSNVYLSVYYAGQQDTLIAKCVALKPTPAK